MRYILTLLAVILASISWAQNQTMKIIPEPGQKNSINLYAENLANYEQSVKLEIDSKGMKISENLPIIEVIPPQTKLLLTTMTPEPNKSYSYKYQYTYIHGDVTGVHDDDYIYLLPFPRGKSYTVDQSYNERPTHMNQYAVDFNMEIGTQITAVRDGVVTRVVDEHNKGCPREECSKYNNFVLVKHSDGSVADYSHIKKNGAQVEIGDRVKAGDPIALSGDTGWASGAHLHFEIYVMQFSGQNSIKAKYYLDKNTVGIPKSGQKYRQEN